MNEAAERLAERIEQRRAVVSVLGLGYVGLPTALTLAEAGFTVLGFDIDDQKVETLNRGESYIEYLPPARVAPLVAAGKLEATTEAERLSEPDVAIICVPTPLDASNKPDLSYVEATGRLLAASLRRGQMVVLESTTYPGTTEEVLLPILATSGLVCGDDFFLAYSPEREDPGNKRFDLQAIPKVVSGVGPAAAKLATALYEKIVQRVVPVSSPSVAEATKLTENIYRAVNIALVNELKVVFAAMGLDIWEVLDAAETKPFGFHRFNPGPGWGGHCIPIDPFYLTWKAHQIGIETRFIELAGTVNREMPHWVTDKLEAALEERGGSLSGSRVMILGLAYKKDVADPRESPAFELIDNLRARGAEVCYHDPHIPHLPHMRSWPDLPPLDSQPLDAATVADQDAVVVATDHTGIDWPAVKHWARLIVDTRGIYRRPAPNVVPA